jgi:transposase
MKPNSSKILDSIEVLFPLAKESIKERSSKFSNKLYTQPQLLTLLCLKVMFNMTYRDFSEHIRLMPDALKAIGLSKSPHFTTLHKASERIDPAVINKLLTKTAKLVESSKKASIDSTCFQKGSASKHYIKRCDLEVKSQKVCMVIDTETQIILGLTITNLRTHDTKLAYRVLRSLLKWLQLDKLTGDKGFDAEHLRMFLRQNLVMPVIAYRLFGTKDNLINELLKLIGYCRRSLSETVNSVIKRRFGDMLRSRLWNMQFKETKLRAIVYNINLYQTLLCIFLNGICGPGFFEARN